MRRLFDQNRDWTSLRLDDEPEFKICTYHCASCSPERVAATLDIRSSHTSFFRAASRRLEVFSMLLDYMQESCNVGAQGRGRYRFDLVSNSISYRAPWHHFTRALKAMSQSQR